MKPKAPDRHVRRSADALDHALDHARPPRLEGRFKDTPFEDACLTGGRGRPTVPAGDLRDTPRAIRDGEPRRVRRPGPRSER